MSPTIKIEPLSFCIKTTAVRCRKFDNFRFINLINWFSHSLSSSLFLSPSLFANQSLLSIALSWPSKAGIAFCPHALQRKMLGLVASVPLSSPAAEKRKRKLVRRSSNRQNGAVKAADADVKAWNDWLDPSDAACDRRSRLTAGSDDDEAVVHQLGVLSELTSSTSRLPLRSRDDFCRSLLADWRQRRLDG